MPLCRRNLDQHRTVPLSNCESDQYSIKEISILTCLPLHRTNASVLEEQPIVHLKGLPRTLWEANLVLRVVSLNKVLHDASRLEKINGFAIREGISQCRDASVRVDCPEPWLLLGVFADVDLLCLVGYTGTS